MKTYKILYNPAAAHGNGLSSAKEIEKYLTDGQFVYEDIMKLTNFYDYLQNTTAEETVVFTGGDGTLNFVFNDLYKKENLKDVYYFAAGTGNDFLNDLGLTKDAGPFKINEYLLGLPEVIVKGEHLRFLNGVGFGMDGYCCEENDRLKSIGKHKSYGQIAFEGVLGKYKRTKAVIIVDGETQEFTKVWMVPTMFGSYYGGGFNMIPEQDRKNPDHLVTAMVIHGVSRFLAVFLFLLVKAGKGSWFPKYIWKKAGREVKVSFDQPKAFQIDGETRVNVLEYEVKIEEN